MLEGCRRLQLARLPVQRMEFTAVLLRESIQAT